MVNVFYNRGKMELSTGATSWMSGTIQIALMSSSYSENNDHNILSEITASELSTTNYTRQTLGTKTVTEDDTNDWISFDAADPVWSSIGPASGGPIIHGAVIFRSGTNDVNSPLICFLDLTNTQVNGGNITIQFPANGIFTLT